MCLDVWKLVILWSCHNIYFLISNIITCNKNFIIILQTSQGEAEGSCANDSSDNEQDEQVLHRNRKQTEESQKETKTRKVHITEI